MDGNRRFAELRGLGKEKGHEFGAEKLLEVLQWSLALGVECLSVYAFSTDNFKRSSAEVDVLFELAERKLDEMASSRVIHSHNVRIQVLGELHMLPEGTRRAAFNAMRTHEGIRKRTGAQRVLCVHGAGRPVRRGVRHGIWG